MAYDRTEEQLCCQVVDDGKGIKRGDMAKLFKLFGKLKRTADLNSEGIGMGLMICQNLVKVNKGTISVHSDGPNKGSTFSFSMHMKLNEPQLENISLLNANKSVTVLDYCFEKTTRRCQEKLVRCQFL